MEKELIYLPVKEYFVNELMNYINETIKEEVFQQIGFDLGGFKHDIFKTETLSKLVAKGYKDYPSFHICKPFEFKLDLIKREFFIREIYLFDLVYYYPNKKEKTNFSIYPKEVECFTHSSDEYEFICIEDKEDYISRFKELKFGLIEEAIAYVKCDYYIDILESLKPSGRALYPL